MTVYVKQTWANGSAGGTPLSASRLSHIESGLEAISNTWTFSRGTAGTDPDAFGSFGAGTDQSKLTAALGQLADDGGGHLVLTRPFEVAPFSIPNKVSVHGHDPEVCQLLNTATNGSNFIIASGTGVWIEGIGINARRELQSATTGSALMIVKPNGTSGGASQISGGMTLTGSVSAGATSIAVTEPSPGGIPVLPRDVITLTSASQFEVVRVSKNYVSGTTIPLEYPTQFAWTTADQVSLALDRPIIDSLLVFGLFIGVAAWHCHNGIIRDIHIPDCFDTGIDIEGGCHGMTVADSYVETVGKFGAAIDDGPDTPDQLGPNQEITIRNLRTRFARGGSGQLDGIYAGRSKDLVIDGGVTDLTAGGECGIRTLAGITERLQVKGHTVHGPDTIRADTFGFKATNQIAFGPGRSTVTGMNIRNVANGIDAGTDASLSATNNTINNVLGHGITMTGSATGVQRLSAGFNTIGEACVTGVRTGGVCTAGSVAYTRGNDIRDASFAPISIDTANGWTHTGD